MTKKNEDMAGSVSEPKGAIPEVKPARSLWPRPHENVRVEPVLVPPRDEAAYAAPVVAPPAAVELPEAEFSAGPEEGYRAPDIRIEPEIEEPIAREPEVYSTPVEEEVPEPVAEDEAPEPDLPHEEPVEDPVLAEPFLTEPGREEPVSVEPDPAPEPAYVPPREERHVSVLDAADWQQPALDDPQESKTGRFVAMAAGIVVALALGAVGFVYGSSALGLKFGGDGGGTSADTTASTAAPSTTPAVNPEELKAMQDRVAALQAELEKMRQDKPGSVPASTPENQPAAANQADTPPPAQQAAAQPQPAPVVTSIPGPTPAPGAANNAPAAPTPSAPPPQAVAPAPTSEPTPKAASPSNTAPPAETVRAEPTPPPATAPAPAPKPKPTEVARTTEPVVPPPPGPGYRTQPSYEDPRSVASPEMPVLQNWAVRDVYNGIAVVQGGRGAPLEVEPGDELPGGNRVLAIRRLGGNWAVITERGIIAGN
ncbi:hypothetical protein IZ6_14550 [Terrihabitans soli]|uniref:Uncharacterized protein n=1 Tax=Terrihabitans soli TaxID=708113 RepID=A0A6S6QUT7_9HYPH|nr:hypothetical protein [Terrihabitans soli]BCJ90720.1 hypothetical protein IZ6_14550 [Terrihabitans soli]